MSLTKRWIIRGKKTFFSVSLLANFPLHLFYCVCNNLPDLWFLFLLLFLPILLCVSVCSAVFTNLSYQVDKAFTSDPTLLGESVFCLVGQKPTLVTPALEFTQSVWPLEGDISQDFYYFLQTRFLIKTSKGTEMQRFLMVAWIKLIVTKSNMCVLGFGSVSLIHVHATWCNPTNPCKL